MVKTAEKTVVQPKVVPRPEQTATVSAPAPAVQPAPQPIAQGCESYRTTFSQYSWNVSTALAICEAESGGNTSALSQTCDRGLMQISCIHADMVSSLGTLYDPTTNIAVAWKIYSANGWRAWSTFNSGKYLTFL